MTFVIVLCRVLKILIGPLMNDMGNVRPLLQTGLENKISFRFQAVRSILNHSREIRYDNDLDLGNTGLETVIFFWVAKQPGSNTSDVDYLMVDCDRRS